MIRPFAAIWLSLAAVSVNSSVLQADETPPNVLMIAIDDLNDWIGCLRGHPQTHTPNIDRLAQRGVLFTNAHCASPACNPSRAALFSGKLPWKTGVWSNSSKKFFQLHPDAQLFTHTLRNAGYRTRGAGKMMHSGATANRKLFEQSFNPEQRWSPFTRGQVEYTAAELPSKKSSSPRHTIVANGLPTTVIPLNGLPSDRRPNDPAGESFDWGPLPVDDSTMGDTQITDWAIEHLQTPAETPFFMGVGYYRPHIPLWAPAKYFQRFADQQIVLPPHRSDDLDDISEPGRRWALEAVTAGLHQTVAESGQWSEAVKAYLACVTFVDAQIGRLLDALDRSPAASTTVIILWSDHGWHLGEKQHWGKWTGWERSTRVPLIIVPPSGSGFGSRGVHCDNPVSLLDIVPTISEFCRIPVSHDGDGQSLMRQLQNPDHTTNRIVPTVFDKGNLSLRSRNWRYLRYAEGDEELYNLQADPMEWTNRISDQSQEHVLAEFREAAAELLKASAE